MIVKELIEQLKKMPEDAIVVTATAPKGSWTVTERAMKAKYEHLDICIILEPSHDAPTARRGRAAMTARNQPKEYNKPGCFGAFGKGKFAHLRDCAKGYCQWEPRCKQSQEDY